MVKYVNIDCEKFTKSEVELIYINKYILVWGESEKCIYTEYMD